MSPESEPAITGGKPAVFLSYAHADQPRAAQLADALQAVGFKVWWDAEIMGGEAFANRIETALQGADAVVVAWSQASVVSDWVRDEAGHARDRKRLVAVSLDGTMPPLGFRQYHALDLSRWQGAAGAAEISQLAAAIHARASDQATSPPVTRLHTVAPSRRNLLLAAGAAGVTGALALGGGLALWRSLTPVNHRSVAVMPFKNIGGDPQQAYFSDGLSDELRTTLAGDQRLRVMGRTSSDSVADDVAAAARKLQVAFLLTGGVQRAGDTLQVSAELTDDKGVEKWGRTFKGSVNDIFAFQAEIAAVALAALMEQVDAGGNPKPVPAGDKPYGGTTNVEAYQDYLKGRELYQRGDDEASDRAALALFEAAVATDPAFAMARAARARSLATIAGSYASAAQARGLYDQALGEATRAASEAPESAYIQATLGQVLEQGHLDVRAARAPYDKARSLGNNDAGALTLVALFAARTGRPDQAAAVAARAKEIDPLNPLVHRAAGMIQVAARQFDKALPPLRQSLVLSPKLPVSNAEIAVVYLQTGRLDDAWNAWHAETDDSLRPSGLAIIERRLGHASAAQKAFATLVSTEGDGAFYQQAQVKAQWGDADGAMTLLLQAYAAGDPGLLDLKTDVLLDPLRPDPRFSNLMTRIGFS